MAKINYSAAIVYGSGDEAPKGGYSVTNSFNYSSEVYDSDTLSQELSSIKLAKRFLEYVSLSANTTTGGKALSAAVNSLDGLGAPTNV